MTRVLIAVSGAGYWTLADGTRHTTGFWPEELVVPYEIFREAGHDIAIATPGGVRPIPDEAGFTVEMNFGDTEAGARFRRQLADLDDELATPLDLDSVSADDFDLLFIPGGHGPMEDLAVHKTFGSLLRSFDAAGKTIAAVCHGPAALLPAVDPDGGWTFAGRRVTGFSNVEETQLGFADTAPWLLADRLGDAGGQYEQADDPWAPYVVVDGNLYTGQNPASTKPLAQQLVASIPVTT
ncbi:type 1 glutamine amidotransferase domain-containing protein [Gordonia sp. NPDC003376]